MKFEFEAKEDYYFSLYEDELKYHRNLVQKQFDAANYRKKDEMNTFRLFAAVAILILVMFFGGAFIAVAGGYAGMFSSAGLIGLIGSGGVFISLLCMPTVLPLALYKSLYGYIGYSISKPNMLGTWILEHYGPLPLIGREIKQCKEFLTKCDYALKLLDQMKDDYEFGTSPDFSEMEQMVQQIKKGSQIPVEELNSAKLKNLTKKIALVVLIIIYIGAFFALKYSLTNAYQGLVEMFRQI